MRRAAVIVAIALLQVGCGGSDPDSPAPEPRLEPKTGERIEVVGDLVKPPPEWPTEKLLLRSPQLRHEVFVWGDLGGLGAGDRVRVEGTFYEYSTDMRSVIRVARIGRP